MSNTSDLFDWLAYFSPEVTDEERKAIASRNPFIKEALEYEKEFFADETKRREYEEAEKRNRSYKSTVMNNKKEYK